MKFCSSKMKVKFTEDKSQYLFSIINCQIYFSELCLGLQLVAAHIVYICVQIKKLGTVMIFSYRFLAHISKEKGLRSVWNSALAAWLSPLLKSGG